MCSIHIGLHSGQELRFTEPIKELKLPPGLEWKGSMTLKTATTEATGVGFFEFLQLIEQFCEEHNIPPTNYERRCVALLLGIQKVHLRTMVLPYVQDIGNYSAEGTDKWSELRSLPVPKRVSTLVTRAGYGMVK